MKVSWLIWALVIFIIGFILSVSTTWTIFGIPLIILSVIVLFIGLALPERRRRPVRERQEVRRTTVTNPVRKAEVAETATRSETPRRSARTVTKKVKRRKRR